MGPHSFECGNGAGQSVGETKYYRFNGAALVRVRKFLLPVWRKSLLFKLQWGRTRSSAEICLRTSASELEMLGFNGAALVRVRK